MEPLGSGAYLVEHDGRRHVVYVAGPDHDRWVFWNGEVFRGNFSEQPAARARGRGAVRQSLASPMPATVVKVLAAPGQAVKKGDTVVVVEAMKMELPLRAPADATVAAVRCREGELVQGDATLVEFE